MDARRTVALIPVTDATFDQEVRGPTPLLVEFAASFGASYPVAAPALEEVSARLDGRVRVGRLDVDENPGACTRLAVWPVPAIMLFVDGAPALRFAGYVPTGRLVRAVERYLATRSVFCPDAAR